MRRRDDLMPILGLYNAVAYAAAFTILGRLLKILKPLPLLTLLMIMALPMIMVWVSVSGRTLRFRITSGQMLGPLLLSLLIFPGFLHLLTAAYGYSDPLKLILIFSSVSLAREIWYLGKQKKIIAGLMVALTASTVLAVLLSEGLAMWPLLWAESAMVLAALSLVLFPFLNKKWSHRVGITYELSCFWTILWTLPWLLAVMWISGRGLPLPPLHELDWGYLVFWSFLFVTAMIITEGLKVVSADSKDYSLVYYFFLPFFALFFAFFERSNRPDGYDLLGMFSLITGSLILQVFQRFVKNSEKQHILQKAEVTDEH